MRCGQVILASCKLKSDFFLKLCLKEINFIGIQCLFGMINFVNLFYYNLFLLLFISFTVLFDTIHRFYCTILVNFYLYLKYFQQKVFSFNKISGFQTDIFLGNLIAKGMRIWTINLFDGIKVVTVKLQVSW